METMNNSHEKRFCFTVVVYSVAFGFIYNLNVFPLSSNWAYSSVLQLDNVSPYWHDSLPSKKRMCLQRDSTNLFAFTLCQVNTTCPEIIMKGRRRLISPVRENKFFFQRRERRSTTRQQLANNLPTTRKLLSELSGEFFASCPQFLASV